MVLAAVSACVYLRYISLTLLSFSVSANESGSTAPHLSSPLVLVLQVHGRNKSTRCQVTRRLMSIHFAPWENRCPGYTNYTYQVLNITLWLYHQLIITSPVLLLFPFGVADGWKTTTWLLWLDLYSGFLLGLSISMAGKLPEHTCPHSRGRANGSPMMCKRPQRTRMMTDLFCLFVCLPLNRYSHGHLFEHRVSVIYACCSDLAN